MNRGTYIRTKEIKEKNSLANMGHVVAKDVRAKISESHKGDKNPRYGKPRSAAVKKKISKTLMGHPTLEYVKKRFSIARKGKNNPNYGKKHSEEARRKMSAANKGNIGKKNPNWRGGITPVLNLIRHSLKYQKWRKDCFIRDQFLCQQCGQLGDKLEVHHKKSFKKLIKEINDYLPLFGLYEGAMIYAPLWDTDNGITLCKQCHRLHKGHN